MQYQWTRTALLALVTGGLVGGPQQTGSSSHGTQVLPTLEARACRPTADQTNFLVLAGGGNPNQNEIALEKNVHYFQRTLRAMGYNPATAHIFFANGNNGQATVRYLDANQRQKFRVPQIPNLNGPSTLGNLDHWITQLIAQGQKNPSFVYFTGHGIPKTAFLWENQELTVQQFARALDRLPPEMPVVTMMAQCFAGSFANFIYQDGNPQRPLALQTRCGFFATIATQPSVGCTPEVNEADYKDYSSSFFAGMSGRSRTGVKVASADYNRDGTITFAEAHAFAKVDEQTTDLPVSTSEVWLQERISQRQQAKVLAQPMRMLLSHARPEQVFVIKGLAARLKFNLQASFENNARTFFAQKPRHHLTPVEDAYLKRLRMELFNIGGEQEVRASPDQGAMPEGRSSTVAILEKLLNCEASSWQK